MSLSKMLKQNAKRAMSGAWGRAAGILVITALPVILLNLLEYTVRRVGGVPEFIDYAGTPGMAFDDMANLAIPSAVITVAMMLLAFLITAPLMMGVVRWYYRRTGGENDPVSEIFYYFETARGYWKAFGLQFSIGLRMIFWELLLFAPLIGGGVLLALAMDGLSGELPNVVYLAAGVLGVIWLVIAALLSAMIMLRYLLAPYLLAEHPDYKIRRVIKQSVRLVKGHKGNLFLFGLSFIGWYLLCLLFLPLFFVIPYKNAAFALYARYLITSGEDTENATREYRPETVETPVQDIVEPEPVIYPPVTPVQDGTAETTDTTPSEQ